MTTVNLVKSLTSSWISQEVGQGLPFWFTNGATIRRELERYIVDKEAAGYQHVHTPFNCFYELYKLQVTGITTVKTCSHQWIWGTGRVCSSSNELPSPHWSLQTPCHSYRELPIRIAEIGMMHRYEKSGAFTGLQRVVKCLWMTVILLWLQNKSRKNSRDPSIDHRCVWRSTWQITVSACLIVIPR